MELPRKVNEILTVYQQLFALHLPNRLSGLYIVGSIALGAYIEGKSDIDFVTVVDRRLNPTEIKEVAKIHRRLRQMFPRIVMEGIYLGWDQLGKSSGEMDAIPYFRDGKMRYDKNCGNACPITWFILKKYGIAIYGPLPANINFTADTDRLRIYVYDNINSYWMRWTIGMKAKWSISRLAGLFAVKIEWGVLGIVRMYYTLIENDIISKERAGEYIIGKIPGKYRLIVNEAICIRRKSKGHYQSPWKRRKDTISFMEFMIKECNTLYETTIHG